jgi:hypothetical protein
MGAGGALHAAAEADRAAARHRPSRRARRDPPHGDDRLPAGPDAAGLPAALDGPTMLPHPARRRTSADHPPSAGHGCPRSGGAGRDPFPLKVICKVQANRRNLDDDLRWLVALVSDTGMRLAEAAGLTRDDHRPRRGSMPHVVNWQHPWRKLKTAGSARNVPLVGAALWAAQRLLAHDTGARSPCPATIVPHRPRPMRGARR